MILILLTKNDNILLYSLITPSCLRTTLFEKNELVVDNIAWHFGWQAASLSLYRGVVGATGGERQTGHVGCRRSHWSTHCWWKACAHPGSTRSTSPGAYSPRHTAQHAAAFGLVVLILPPSSLSYTTLGSALSAASSIPAASTSASSAAARSSSSGTGAGAVASREHMRRR
jgi:hypothetical protein